MASVGSKSYASKLAGLALHFLLLAHHLLLLALNLLLLVHHLAGSSPIKANSLQPYELDIAH